MWMDSPRCPAIATPLLFLSRCPFAKLLCQISLGQGNRADIWATGWRRIQGTFLIHFKKKKKKTLKCKDIVICTRTDTQLRGGSFMCFQNRPISSWQGFNEVLETLQREPSPCSLKSITLLLQFYQQDFQARNNLNTPPPAQPPLGVLFISSPEKMWVAGFKSPKQSWDEARAPPCIRLTVAKKNAQCGQKQQ